MIADNLEERSLQCLAFLPVGCFIICATVVWPLGEKLRHQDEERQQ